MFLKDFNFDLQKCNSERLEFKIYENMMYLVILIDGLVLFFREFICILFIICFNRKCIQSYYE